MKTIASEYLSECGNYGGNISVMRNDHEKFDVCLETHAFGDVTTKTVISNVSYEQIRGFADDLICGLVKYDKGDK